jgi:hypothetical protein
MTSDDEFIQRLTEFALSEKGARVYFQLLKYGPQPAAVVAKRLKRAGLKSLLPGGLRKKALNGQQKSASPVYTVTSTTYKITL